MFRHENVFRDNCVAASAFHPGHVPGVFNYPVPRSALTKSEFAISPASFFMWMPHAALRMKTSGSPRQRPFTNQPPSAARVPARASEPAIHASESPPNFVLGAFRKQAGQPRTR